MNKQSIITILFALAALMKQNLLELFKKYPSADKRAMGFPCGWENEPLWK